MLPYVSRDVLENKWFFEITAFVCLAGLSGNWYGMLENVGNDVNPWSSVANNEDNAYNLNANSDGNVNPDNNDNRNNGNVVRCVAR